MKMHINPKDIINAPQEFDKSMSMRGDPIRAPHVIEVYNDWKDSNLELEKISSELNSISKNFRPDKVDEAKRLRDRQADLQMLANDKREKLDYVLDRIPNMLDEKVPSGSSSEENVVIEYCGQKKVLDKPIHHEEIGVKLGMWGRDEAVSMSGSRFICLTGNLARLERTLANYVLDLNVAAGFTEISVPFLIRKESLYNTGQLPKFSEDFFQLDGFALIPTGEIPLLNYYVNKTLDLNALPIKVTTMTPCFRSEAGSLGRDTKGLTRLHQFQKVEMVAITKQDESERMHFELLDRVKMILDSLDLHYRVVEVCSGDIGFTASRQFDVEVWMPGQNKYVEVASCSNCRDFQAHRMKTKYRDADGKLTFVHTLNCTAIACGRIIAAILETHCSSGEFYVPSVLQSYWK